MRRYSFSPMVVFVLAGCASGIGSGGDGADDPAPGVEDSGAPRAASATARDGGPPPAVAPPRTPSCRDAKPTCGAGGDDDCCRASLVPGGTFARTNRAGAMATVSPFALDVYEVNVSRFRAFVQSGGGTRAKPPANGAGAHPKVPATGWSPTYAARLPATTKDLVAELDCKDATYTNEPGANENRPVACVSWYVAFAFCAWDDGRLPSEAEASFAAAGGDEQRVYPWSSPPSLAVIDPTYATYSASATTRVGAHSPVGDGRWGHADLGGNIAEWTLDAYVDPLPAKCDDCVTLGAPDPMYRVRSGGGFIEGPQVTRIAYRTANAPVVAWGYSGLRCARSP